MIPVAFLFCVACPFGLLVLTYNTVFKDRKAKNAAARERFAKYGNPVEKAKLEKRKHNG